MEYISIATIIVIVTILILCLFCLWKKSRDKLHKVDRMDGAEFEKFLNNIFIKQGYDSRVTKTSHDFGADIIIENWDGDKRAVIQAKRYSDTVPIAAVQQVFASMYYYDADVCLVISNSFYSGSAVKMAEKIGVFLIDRDGLKEIVEGQRLDMVLTKS